MKRRAAWIVTASAFVGAIAVDRVVGTSHVPGYSAAIGFAGCVGIILVSKWLGKILIQRPEDYYPFDAPADVQEDLHG